MVILSSSGFQINDKCGELKKLVRNRKVFICNNAIERPLYKKKHFQNIQQNIGELVARVDEGELTVENAFKYTEYYDCIYLAEGNLRILSDTLKRKDIESALRNFINSGKTLITEGIAGHLLCADLDYLNFIANTIDQPKIYDHINYAILTSLQLTKEKYIFHVNKLKKSLKGACKLAEKHYRTTINLLNDGEMVVL